MHPVQAAPRQSCLLLRQSILNSDAPRAGSAEAKSRSSVIAPTAVAMHPVQAAPRQSYRVPVIEPLGVDAPRAGSAEAKTRTDSPCEKLSADAPRAGSAEAKCFYRYLHHTQAWMHPVQAAPRQSSCPAGIRPSRGDAPRAGSAEAKCSPIISTACLCRCTPCRQRRGKAERVVFHLDSV